VKIVIALRVGGLFFLNVHRTVGRLILQMRCESAHAGLEGRFAFIAPCSTRGSGGE